jgi:hypothetical protein
MLSSLRRITWWQILILIACLFGLFMVCLSMWLRGSGDLEAVDQRARELQLPVALSDITFATTDPARLADWQRLLILGDQLKPWSENEAAQGWTAGFGQLPEALLAHHAALDATLLAESTAILARLGDAPIDAHRDLAPAATLPDVAALRRHMRLRCERILLARPETLPSEIVAAAALIPAREPPGLLRLMVQANLIEQWTTAVIIRSADLGPGRVAIAALAEHLAPLAPMGLSAAWRNDLASLRGFVANADPAAVWTRLGRDGGSWSPNAWGFAIALRAGRAETITLMQDIAAAQGEPLDARRQLTATRAAEATARQASWWRPGTLLPAMTLPVATPVIAGAHSARLRLLVLAAELRGAAWPIDQLDPAGKPVRRVERDGRLIGAYSVGADGVDDEGHPQADRCWPLYAPLGTPRAGDPVPTP